MALHLPTKYRCRAAAHCLSLCFACAFSSSLFPQHNEEEVLDALDGAATAVAPRVEGYYRQIHQHPELGKQEFETSKLVRKRLEELGFRQFVDVASLPTAVVAIMDTGRPGKTIALRSELDARPGTEDTGLPFSSTLPNRVHSCGHDAHAAILLGVAEVIKTHESLFAGRIVFLFQPAEETAGGADDIVRENLLSKLGVRSMLAQHSAPGLAVGKFQVSPGAMLAGSNNFTVDIKGKGGHAAAPHETDDVVTGTAAIVAEVSRFPARSLDVLRHPCVVSVTYVSGGDSEGLNVLPSQAQFCGTIRSFDPIDDPIAGSNSIRTLFLRTVNGVAAEHGVSVDIDIRKGPPPTVNDVALYETLLPELQHRLGAETIMPSERGMFSEDFAYYTAVVPCLYFSLGVHKDGLGGVPVHSEKFTIHPDALKQGVRLMSNAAQLLSRP
jgi:amidohydrolase